MHRSSSSVFMACRPRRYARGTKRYIVSLVIFICLLRGIAPSVRMLCRRSAILMMITRTSSESVSNTLRKYSACSVVSFLYTPAILVSPSTIDAILGVKIRDMSSTVYSVSSTTSCSSAATTDFLPRPISLTAIIATSIGWMMYGSPERRRTPLCASLASRKARLTNSQSSSLLHTFALRHSSCNSCHFSSMSISSSGVYFIIRCFIYAKARLPYLGSRVWVLVTIFLFL